MRAIMITATITITTGSIWLSGFRFSSAGFMPAPSLVAIGQIFCEMTRVTTSV